jgi:alkanesulfonate monooxygenase SsuD/methylene tetrahydromethanopterin reductase-like flavin-dependent oxidoreductase (luciferase family)
MADNEAVDQYVQDKQQGKSSMATREIRTRWAGGNGGYPLVGSPERIVNEMIRIHQLGFAGTTLKFVNYLDEFPFFVERVVPLMQQAGLRAADGAMTAKMSRTLQREESKSGLRTVADNIETERP